jgi:hypothetical protein
MDEQQWIAMDAYLCDRTQTQDEVLDAALTSSTEAGLPAINVAPTSTNTTAFRLYQDGPVNVFYCSDHNVMLEPAHDVYAHLTPSTPG